ncbi:MAG: DUF4920 domain-containing protein [Myxococcota bacterium]
MQNGFVLSVALVSLVLSACQAPPAGDSEPTAAATASAHEATEHEHEHEEGCADDHGKAGADDTVRKGKDPKSGAQMLMAGKPLAGVGVVTVKDLTATPEKYAGKVVRLEGNVNAMCHHRRGWFSVQDEADRTGGFVRVLTAPGFLVPAGSIGKKARAEGTVDVIEVSAAAARHYAKGHKIGDPNEIKGPVKRVVIKATGAEFI